MDAIEFLPAALTLMCLFGWLFTRASWMGWGVWIGFGAIACQVFGS